MKGRENRAPPSADLLVCFPSRAHLSLMPKPICSPARPPDSAKRHHRHHHHLRNFSNRGGRASPHFWAKPKPMDPENAEPTSPKVTCAGQIKVRPKSGGACKSWQSVMEEIERLHTNRKHKKRATWAEALGFKKDTLQFLTCLRRLRFDFRCFGALPTSDVVSSDDEDDDDDADEGYKGGQVGAQGLDGDEASGTVFSKWFMVLQEEQSRSSNRVTKEQGREGEKSIKEGPVAPPPNALLLMRSRSAPAKSLLEEREEDEEEQRKKKSNSLAVVMKYDTDFYKLSSDVAKETWVVGGVRDPLSRSRSWKR